MYEILVLCVLELYQPKKNPNINLHHATAFSILLVQIFFYYVILNNHSLYVPTFDFM